MEKNKIVWFAVYTIAFVIGFVVLYSIFGPSNNTAEPTVYTNEVFTFETETTQFTVQYTDNTDKAQVSLNGAQYDLEIARSASGARYESSDGSIVFIEHQGKAYIEIDGETVIDGATLKDDTNATNN